MLNQAYNAEASVLTIQVANCDADRFVSLIITAGEAVDVLDRVFYRLPTESDET